ncbi:MAG: hypothetical protein HY896_09975 [Deltaproteobacteria bacterium]|nr:hypothetical protein [Deltaproteobacteria bacterium]
MGRVRMIAILLFLPAVFGCASSGALEAQIQHLRNEINRDISRSEERTRKDQNDLEARVRKDLGEVDTKNRREIGELGKSVRTEVQELKETQKKYSLETDRTLLDHQKQIYQGKAVLDDSVRRVYLLEKLVITPGVATPQQVREGIILFVEGNKATISHGNVNGIKAGDRMEVVKNNEKIAVIEIETVERESSRGTIQKETKKISIGDKVEPEKKP